MSNMDIMWPFPEPDRVMFAGDWHGNIRAADSAIMAAGATGVPLVFQLGDFGFWAGSEGKQYLDHISVLAQKHGVNVAWIDGNHENFELLYQLPIDPDTGLRKIRDRLYHVPRASRWKWSDVQFTALGGGTSLDRLSRTPGRSWWAEETITYAQAEKVCNAGQTDVLLTHDCPDSVPIPGIDRLSSLRFWPETELRTAWAHRELLDQVVQVVQPTHIFHGHFHVPYMVEVSLCPQGQTSVVGLGDDSYTGQNRATVDLALLAADVAKRRGN